MFCFQCEQAAKGTGCTIVGVCGKTPETAALQDLLVYSAKGLSQWAVRARSLGVTDHAWDVAVMEALFTTVTNVNFDPASVAQRIWNVVDLRDAAKAAYLAACAAQGKTPDAPGGPADLVVEREQQALSAQAAVASIEDRMDHLGEDIVGLQEMLTYGLKGMAAYADHAMVLGQEDDVVYAYLHEALDFLCDPSPTVEALLAQNMRCGEINLRVLELLDSANTGAYGHPVPTSVRTTPVAGKCILVSGHDLKDLEVLLQQTEGTGINIYTHGEMLPAHGYPELNKYPHLVGHYGGAWQLQWGEFGQFPGSIVMTTNCIQEPMDSYADRIFTCGLVAWPGIGHIAGRDFAPAIAAAQAAAGFGATDPDEKAVMVGFGHNTVLGVAPAVIDAVKAGVLKRFVLIGGCDGAKPGRNYFTELATGLPQDTVVLTLGCGKFRFNKQEFGTLGGLPRLLDMGQCNDAYSAIKVAVALAEAFGCGVNDLPLSLVLSWYEQKACCILLSLLYLGIKNIRIGPSLPAFATPAILDVLVNQFGLLPTGTVEKDMAAIIG
ncbi:MAG: hydroxylamine reductase [Armatimonadetes bacterium]|nr:hydroxylamine reductase [Armatimonadota bacterium]